MGVIGLWWVAIMGRGTKKVENQCFKVNHVFEARGSYRETWAPEGGPNAPLDLEIWYFTF